jgi:hypothetical protein
VQSLWALDAPTRIDEFRKKFRCGRGNRGSPVGVFKYDKVAIICIDNDGTGFLTYQQPAEVIPRTMCVPRAIDVAIDNLGLNENIRVEDVKEEHYEILNSPRIPMASVVMTRQLKQEEAAATAGAKK